MNIVMEGNARKQVFPKRPKKDKTKKDKDKRKNLPDELEVDTTSDEGTLSEQSVTAESVNSEQTTPNNGESLESFEDSTFALPPIDEENNCTVDTEQEKVDSTVPYEDKSEKVAEEQLESNDTDNESMGDSVPDASTTAHHSFSLSKKKNKENSKVQSTASTYAEDVSDAEDMTTPKKKSKKEKRSNKNNSLSLRKRKNLPNGEADNNNDIANVESVDMSDNEVSSFAGNDFLSYPLIVGCLICAAVFGYLIATMIVDKVIR